MISDLPGVDGTMKRKKKKKIVTRSSQTFHRTADSKLSCPQKGTVREKFQKD